MTALQHHYLLLTNLFGSRRLAQDAPSTGGASAVWHIIGWETGPNSGGPALLKIAGFLKLVVSLPMIWAL